MSPISKVLFSTLFAVSAAAQADTTFHANGEGWCANYDLGGYTCNNVNTQSWANLYAGTDGHGLDTRNWMAFKPSAGHVEKATISIFNDGLDTDFNPAAVYSLHAATAVDFGSLGVGPSLGSVTAGEANSLKVRYVDIQLNAFGVAYLNAHQGQQVIFGGVVTGSGHTGLFGGSRGVPEALLTVSAVPEPENYAMLLAGLGLVGWLARRKQRVA